MKHFHAYIKCAIKSFSPKIKTVTFAYPGHVKRVAQFNTIVGKNIVVVAQTIANSNTETREPRQCFILTSVDSNEPVQPPCKLRNQSKNIKVSD